MTLMGLSLKSLWSRIGQTAPAEADEPKPESRREQIVRRQREQNAAAIQSRLSRQQTDEHSEEAAEPLYGSTAYSSPPR
jgi:hypothetical protein